ncbi:hypothetical protein [Amycolatopsis sp. Hca4]|uniref:TRAFAC clade GTPase domain-containing protein n=1 Tax=Amycolatopsis sp. Hca4 TaxID=2742131 RepID=UPI0015901348|nr:hypothetical protein [Amycolatopsis sp. Hca4]QKV79935.1 hypothetical protein HUT10_43645 [Amycolatopsis sp. Hca4]
MSEPQGPRTPEPLVPRLPPSPMVLCPICVDRIVWPEQLFRSVVKEQKVVWEAVELSRHTNPAKYEYYRARSYVRCPNPSQDGTPTHYLPAMHKDYGAPVVIGVVGRAGSGKTHLLITMLSEMLRGGLHQHGLTFEVADRNQHDESVQAIQQLREGKVLASTIEDRHVFTSYLLVHKKGAAPRPLIFFDVAGEDFVEQGFVSERRAQFIVGADALLFVDDPARGLPQWRPGTKPPGGPEKSQLANRAFDGAIARLRAKGRNAELAAAIALTKADELRYEYPVDHWLRREDVAAPLDPEVFRQESRDVYATLVRYDATSLLQVVEQFDRRTLHFVSATGGAATAKSYPRGIRPSRVLQPVLALLAMTGVVDGPEAHEVGR